MIHLATCSPAHFTDAKHTVIDALVQSEKPVAKQIQHVRIMELSPKNNIKRKGAFSTRKVDRHMKESRITTTLTYSAHHHSGAVVTTIEEITTHFWGFPNQWFVVSCEGFWTTNRGANA